MTLRAPVVIKILLYSILVISLVVFALGCSETSSQSVDIESTSTNSKDNPDSDHDGYADEVDDFPSDYRYHLDADCDGYADEVDDFPSDHRYHLDSDNDGYADEVDNFPSDSRYHLDSDSDGYANEVDDLPSDSRYHSDYDHDGFADEVDDFPSDPRHHLDSDHDGYADEVDDFPLDSKYHLDSDNDGYADEVDDFPSDSRYHSEVTDVSFNVVSNTGKELTETEFSYYIPSHDTSTVLINDYYRAFRDNNEPVVPAVLLILQNVGNTEISNLKVSINPHLINFYNENSVGRNTINELLLAEYFFQPRNGAILNKNPSTYEADEIISMEPYGAANYVVLITPPSQLDLQEGGHIIELDIYAYSEESPISWHEYVYYIIQKD